MEQKEYVTSIRTGSADLIDAINEILKSEGYKSNGIKNSKPSEIILAPENIPGSVSDISSEDICQTAFA